MDTAYNNLKLIINMRSKTVLLSLVGVASLSAAIFALLQKPVNSGLFLQANIDSIDREFSKYLAKHGKSYATKEEYLMRKEIFTNSLIYVVEANSQNGATF